MNICPLCDNSICRPFHRDAHREYLRCGRCALVFVPREFFLSPGAERAEYDLHQNHPADPGYRHFLSRLVDPLLLRLAPGSSGLDFGCGPGPALAAMLEEAGHRVRLYDVFYRPDVAALSAQYDFITATEVVEHLFHPGRELERLWACLRPGGLLGIMTKRVRSAAAFANWHYKNDLTHVCFFAEETFEYLARRFGAELEVVGDDTVILRKPES